MKRRTLCLASLLCAASLLAAPQSRPAASSARPGSHPKLVVMVVIDQFRYDYLTRFRAEYTGGLARLLDNGAVFTNATYQHFPTVTAVGHSTVLSGALPAVSGIVGNEWLDRKAGRQVTSVSDTDVEILGATARMGASPKRLMVSTLSDEMKMSGKGQCKAIGISMKDRSAILPAGHMADAAYWFDGPTGNFVSSTYYMKELPGWVRDFNSSRIVDKFVGAEWAPVFKGPSAWPAKLFGKLPNKPGKPYYDAVYRSPFGNDVLVEMVIRAIDGEHLGQNGGTDLLSVSFSSNDAVGHAVGPDAPEVHDMCVRTDRSLAKLFQHLDEKVGLSNVIVVLTADHGVAPLPELMAQRRMPGGRMTEEAVLKVAEDAIVSKFGPGKWVIGHSGPAPYFDHALIQRKGLDLRAVQNVAADAVRALPNITRVFTSEELKQGQIPDDPISRKIRNGFYYERASDLFIVAAPYWLFEDHGTSHGTPYNYDSHVPVVFMGPGVKSGRYYGPIAVNDIAPTLATMLSVEVPSGAMGRVLSEILTAR